MNIDIWPHYSYISFVTRNMFFEEFNSEFGRWKKVNLRDDFFYVSATICFISLELNRFASFLYAVFVTHFVVHVFIICLFKNSYSGRLGTFVLASRGQLCKENLGQVVGKLEETREYWQVAEIPKKNLGKIRKSWKNLEETRKDKEKLGNLGKS